MTTRNMFGSAALTVGALLLACAIGPTVGGWEPARSPAGVTVTVTLSDRELRDAELLEVGDSALLLLTMRREMTRVFYGQVRGIHGKYGPSAVLRGRPPRAQEIAEWRPLSRFPQGLTEEQLKTLLAFYRRDAVEIVR